MRILFNIFLPISLFVIYTIFFGHKSEQIIIFFYNYKFSFSLGFVLIIGFISLKLFNYIIKLISGIFWVFLNIQKIWQKRQKKELLNKLFLILYYISIEDKKKLESILVNIKLYPDSKIPAELFNIVKYIGGKYLNDKLITGPIISEFMTSKNNKTLGLKYLIEEKISENDFGSAKILLSQLGKNDSKLNWARKYDAEIEKTSGNLELAIDKLAILEKFSDSEDEIKIKEEIKDLLLNKAKYLIDVRNLDEAKKYLKKILKIYPENIDSILLLIEIHIKKRNKWRASRLIKKAWLIAPSEELLRKFELNNPKIRVSELINKQKILLQINNSLTSMMAFAKYLVNMGEFNKAREYMSQISKKQQSPEYYRLLSEIELKTNGDIELIKQLVEKSN